MLRHDRAIGFLLELIATGSLSDATDALQALQVYRNDQGLWARVQEAIAQRKDGKLSCD